jgi:hypothetical protein
MRLDYHEDKVFVDYQIDVNNEPIQKSTECFDEQQNVSRKIMLTGDLASSFKYTKNECFGLSRKGPRLFIRGLLDLSIDPHPFSILLMNVNLRIFSH